MTREALNSTERILDKTLKVACILKTILVESSSPFIQRKPYRVLMPKRERQNPRIIRKEKRKNLRMHNKILSFWQQQRRIKMRTICRNHPVIFSPIPFSAPRGLGLSTFCVIRMVSLLHTSSFTSSWKKYTLLLLEYSNSFFFFFLAVPPWPLGS